MALEQDIVLLEHMPDGVVICDRVGRIVYVNPRFEQLTGYRAAYLEGKPIEFLVPEGAKRVHRDMRTAYSRRPRTRPMGQVERDYRLLRRAGRPLSVDIALAPVTRAGERQVLAVVRDISARRKLEATLERAALHDPLTGLANRTLFMDRLTQALLQGARDRRQVALVMLDLDRFKSVNDEHGHQAGDRVLVRVAQRLARGLRATDTVARIGGDEFAWVLPGIGGRSAAMVMMGKLLQGLPARVTVDGSSIEIGVSAGLAIFPDDGDDFDALMRVADVRLYASKRRAPTDPYSR
jgi:diguanylate cyclase (GGDEF)-like protein/PAS domain S-box-containing protein